MTQIQDSPTSYKLNTIICNRLNIQRGAINRDTNLSELFGKEANHVIGEIVKKFLIPVDGRLLNLHGSDGQYVKRSFNEHLPHIKTVWNLLQFIEANDGWNGKPAAYNLQ